MIKMEDNAFIVKSLHPFLIYSIRAERVSRDVHNDCIDDIYTESGNNQTCFFGMNVGMMLIMLRSSLGSSIHA